MPYNVKFDLPVGDRKIPQVTALVNVVPVPEPRRDLPGAGSGIAIDLTAVQQLVDLIAEDVVSPEEAASLLRSVAIRLDEGNDEFDGVPGHEEPGGVRRGAPPAGDDV